MTKIKDLPSHKRPREKLIELGVAGLKDKELLAILLRTGTGLKNAIELADEVLKKTPLKKLLQLKFPELIKIKGIEDGKATTLLAAFELTRRALEVDDNSLPTILTARDALNHLQDIKAAQKEHFVALYLNARNQLIDKEVISVGIINAGLVHPREVFKPAVENLAVSVIVAHNHPSGNLEASQEDIIMTEKLKKAGEILGIEVLDSLIITTTGFSSFRERGIF